MAASRCEISCTFVSFTFWIKKFDPSTIWVTATFREPASLLPVALVPFSSSASSSGSAKFSQMPIFASLALTSAWMCALAPGRLSSKDVCKLARPFSNRPRPKSNGRGPARRSVPRKVPPLSHASTVIVTSLCSRWCRVYFIASSAQGSP